MRDHTIQWWWGSLSTKEKTTGQEDNKETNVNTEDNVNTEEEVDNWKVENE